jgi:hypothetical protein
MNEPAYRVPWIFTRPTRGNRFYLDNVSSERLTGVTITIFGRGLMPVALPAAVAPGGDLEFAIFGDDLAKDTVGVVRWFRPNGDEYLWRVSF